MRTSEGPEVKNFRHYSLGEIVEIKSEWTARVREAGDGAPGSRPFFGR
jgi:hypothetical protein